MCMIAAYTGSRPAAPILIDMLRREEGFWSGYYTGIATVHEGKLYWAKVLGDLDELLRTTDAAAFPGATGVIHGRTPSGGGREWAYPFVSCDGRMALVENGSPGVFKETVDFAPYAARLLEQGHMFSSRFPGPVSDYPRLPDGGCLHYAEIYCHLCEEYIKQGEEPLAALMRMQLALPAEAVAVMVHAEHPGALFAARYNQPMTLARASGESFLATSPTAFPADREYLGFELLAAGAGTRVTAAGYETRSLTDPPLPVQPITAAVTARAWELVRKALAEAAEPLPFPEIAKICSEAFTGEGLSQSVPVGYAVVDALLKEGLAELITLRVEGMTPELTAPLFRLRETRGFFEKKPGKKLY